MFYDRLKDLCRTKGVTLTNLVKDLNMSTGNLSKWKNGNVPKSDTIRALAEYLGVTADYLLGNDIRKEKILTLLDDPAITLTSDEKWFILKLRQLDKDGRTMVESSLISELRRVEAKNDQQIVG